MPKTLDEVAKDVMELPLPDRLALAEAIFDGVDLVSEAEAEAAWSEEIRERIRAIDEGRVVGIPYEEVMREAKQWLSS